MTESQEPEKNNTHTIELNCDYDSENDYANKDSSNNEGPKYEEPLYSCIENQNNSAIDWEDRAIDWADRTDFSEPSKDKSTNDDTSTGSPTKSRLLGNKRRRSFSDKSMESKLSCLDQDIDFLKLDESSDINSSSPPSNVNCYSDLNERKQKKTQKSQSKKIGRAHV